MLLMFKLIVLEKTNAASNHYCHPHVYTVRAFSYTLYIYNYIFCIYSSWFLFLTLLFEFLIRMNSVTFSWLKIFVAVNFNIIYVFTITRKDTFGSLFAQDFCERRKHCPRQNHCIIMMMFLKGSVLKMWFIADSNMACIIYWKVTFTFTFYD